MIDLLSQVKVGVPSGTVVEWKPGVLVGRTIESEPRYDVRDSDGQLHVGVIKELVEPADCPRARAA